MKTNYNSLSSGLEDYIEIIYRAQLSSEKLKASELAKKLNISRASVSEALSKLNNKGLIKYESFGNILLTDSGEKEAKKVYTKHSIIKNFFETVLSTDSKEAEENACKIEHFISVNILKSMASYTNFCQKHTEIADMYRKEYSD